LLKCEGRVRRVPSKLGAKKTVFAWNQRGFFFARDTQASQLLLLAVEHGVRELECAPHTSLLAVAGND
jgi:hypothetical protein